MSLACTGVAVPLVPSYRFSLITFPLPERTETPCCVLNPIVLAAPLAEPPIVLVEPAIEIPPLPTVHRVSTDKVALDQVIVGVDRDARSRIELITFAVADVVPPIVFPDIYRYADAVTQFVACCVGSDQVAHDQVARRSAPLIEMPAALLNPIVFPALVAVPPIVAA